MRDSEHLGRPLGIPVLLGGCSCRKLVGARGAGRPSRPFGIPVLHVPLDQGSLLPPDFRLVIQSLLVASTDRETMYGQFGSFNRS